MTYHDDIYLQDSQTTESPKPWHEIEEEQQRQYWKQKEAEASQAGR